MTATQSNRQFFSHPITRGVLTTLAILAVIAGILFLAATLTDGGSTTWLAIGQLSSVIRFVGMAIGLAGLFYVGLEAMLMLNKARQPAPTTPSASPADLSQAEAPITPIKKATPPCVAETPGNTPNSAPTPEQQPSPSLSAAMRSLNAIQAWAREKLLPATPPQMPPPPVVTLSPAGSYTSPINPASVSRRSSKQLKESDNTQVDPTILEEQRLEMEAAGMDMPEKRTPAETTYSTPLSARELRRTGLFPSPANYSAYSATPLGSDTTFDRASDDEYGNENETPVKVDQSILEEQRAELLAAAKAAEIAAAAPPKRTGWASRFGL